MKKNILNILLIFLVLNVAAQSERKYIRRGNSSYTEKKFNDAEVYYQKALNVDSNSVAAANNLASAFYKQNQFEKAENIYSSIAKKETNKQNLAQIYHNLGNAQLKQTEPWLKEGKIKESIGKIEQSIESYKNSLRNFPSDKQTKYNLAYAQMILKQLKAQQQNQQNQEQEQEDKKQEDQQNSGNDADGDGIPDSVEKESQQTPPDTDKDGDQNYKDTDSDNDGILDSKEAGADPSKPQDTDKDGTPDYKDLDSNNDGVPDAEDAKKFQNISKEDAERILQAIQNEEKKTQDKVKKAKQVKVNPNSEKNW